MVRIKPYAGTLERRREYLRRARASGRKRAIGRRSKVRRRLSTKHIRKTILRMHEPKMHYQTVYNGVEMALDTPGVALSLPTVGSGADEREGDKIYLDHLKVTAVVTKENDLGDELCRILIVRWKGDNAHDSPIAGAGVLNEILETTLWGTPNTVQAPYIADKALRSKFEVVWDKRFIMTQQNGPGNTAAKKMFVFTLPLKRMHKFEDAGQTGPNNMYCWVLSNYAAAARASPIIMMQVLLQFKEV